MTSSPRANPLRPLALTLLLSFALLSGCAHSKPRAIGTVYVSAKQAYLRDRIAAVSQRTATVTNGQRLDILAAGRRVYQVRTDKGEVGWIKEAEVIPSAVADQFAALQRTYAYAPVVATAQVHDEASLHLSAGRESDKFYILPEGDKLQLLARASVLKPLPPGSAAAKSAAPSAPNALPPPPPMEDWWLVRDAQHRTGWIYSRMIDVESPDTLGRYSENQRTVSALVLTTVNDPDADAADKNIPVYVVAYAPYKSGLPYDFDQIRVFTWNRAKHRYETAYREHNIEGFLPLTVGTVAPSAVTDVKLSASLASAPLPTFSYKVLADTASITVDPATGIAHPGQLIEKDYRVEGNYVRRVLLPGQTSQTPEAHPAPEPKKPATHKRR